MSGAKDIASWCERRKDRGNQRCYVPRARRGSRHLDRPDCLEPRLVCGPRLLRTPRTNTLQLGGGPSSSRLESVSLLSMGDAENNVPDELEDQLDDLAEELRDPDRSDRAIEDQPMQH